MKLANAFELENWTSAKNHCISIIKGVNTIFTCTELNTNLTKNYSKHLQANYICLDLQ